MAEQLEFGVRLRARVADYRRKIRQAGRSTRDVFARMGRAAREAGPATRRGFETAAAGARGFRAGLSGLTNSLRGLGAVVPTVGAALVGFFSVRAVARFFGGAVESSRAFEAQLARVRAATGATGDEFDALRAKAEELGGSTRFTATEAAEGLEILGRAGVNATDSIELLPNVLQFATANSIDLATSAGLVTDALGAFGEEVAEAGRFADVLAQGSRLANTNVRQLGRAVSYAGVQASQMGMSVEDTVAVLDALAEAGIRGERAGTALRSILGQLQDPASTARQALRELGIDTEDLTEVIRGLNEAGPAARDAINAFGLEAGPGIRTLLQQGTEGIAEYRRELEGAAGTSAEMADITRGTLDAAIEGLKARWDALRRSLVGPVIGRLNEELRVLADTIAGVTSGDSLERFQRQILDAFNSGVRAVKDFTAAAGGIDGVLATVIGGTQRALQALQAFGRQASNIAGGFRVAWNLVTVTLNGVAAAIFGLTRATADWSATIARGLQLLTGYGGQAVEFFEGVSEVAGRSFDEAARRVNQDIDDIVDAVSDGGRRTRTAAEGFADAGDDAAEALERTRRDAEKARGAYEVLTSAISQAAAEHERAALRIEAARLFEDGAITAEEYDRALTALLPVLGELPEALGNVADAGEGLNQQNKDNTTSTDDAAEAARRARQEYEDLASAVGNLADAGDIATAQQILRKQFQQGTISGQEYADTLYQIALRATELRKAAEEAAEGLKDASEEGENFTRVGGDMGRSMREATGVAAALGGWLATIKQRMEALSGAARSLFDAKRGFDDVTTAAEAANQRIREIEERLTGLGTGVYFDSTGIIEWVSEVQRAALETELAFRRQERAVALWQQRLESGRVTARDLDTDLETLEDRFDLLDRQQLSGLRSELRRVQSQISSLRDSADGVVSSLADELDRFQGDFEAIERRRAQQQREQIREQLGEAQELGDEEAIADLRRALELLGEVETQRLKEARRREQEEAKRESEEARRHRERLEGEERRRRDERIEEGQRKRKPERVPPAEFPERARETVRIELVSPGGELIELATDPRNVERLLDTLAQAGLRST